MKIDGKAVKKNKAILIYNLFADKPVDGKKYLIQFRDNDTYNAAFDNLYIISRKEYYAKKNMNGKPKFTDEEKNKIRKEYKSKRSHLSIRELCKKYSCSLLTMQKILKEKK